MNSAGAADRPGFGGQFGSAFEVPNPVVLPAGHPFGFSRFLPRRHHHDDMPANPALDVSER
jgi:hypothetical protein